MAAILLLSPRFAVRQLYIDKEKKLAGDNDNMSCQ